MSVILIRGMEKVNGRYGTYIVLCRDDGYLALRMGKGACMCYYLSRLHTRRMILVLVQV